jgi:hypothetical protein
MVHPLSPDGIRDRVEKIDAPIPVGAVFFTPIYEEEFVSEQFPEMNGLVKLEFPSVKKVCEISRIATLRGDTKEDRIIAGLEMCCVAAPNSWYSMPPGAQKPVLDLGKHFDFFALFQLYERWCSWQNSFRRKAE